MSNLPPHNHPAGTPPQPANKRSSKALGLSIVFALIALCCLGGVIIAVIGADKDESRGFSGPPRIEEVEGEATASPVPAPKPKSKPAPVALEAGTYEVGSRTSADAETIKAGKWRIATPEDGLNCYWATLRNLDGELTSIRSNGNVPPGSSATVNVKASDAGLELLGDCRATAK